MKKNYSKKLAVINTLVALNKKQINKEDIMAACKQHSVSFSVGNTGWTNFVQSSGAYIDRTVNNCDQNSASTVKIPRGKRTANKINYSITTKEAGSIIKEYMHNNSLKVNDFCDKHKISINQFYDWIRELTVSGTLLGRTILKPNKYGKQEVVNVIWWIKHPNTTRKAIRSLSQLQLKNYERVKQVLEQYL